MVSKTDQFWRYEVTKQYIGVRDEFISMGYFLQETEQLWMD